MWFVHLWRLLQVGNLVDIVYAHEWCVTLLYVVQSATQTGYALMLLDHLVCSLVVSVNSS